MADDLLEAVKEGSEEKVTRLLDAHPELLHVVPSQLERNTELANAAPWLVNAELLNTGAALAQEGGIEALTQGVAGLTESVLLQHVLIERRPLIVAAEHGHLGLVRLLIQKGADPRATGVLGTTALRAAILQGHDEVAAFLLSNGAEGHVTDVRDTNLLMEAAGDGHLGAVKLLLHHTGGQGLEDQDDEGQTALSYAAREGHKEVVDYLLSNEARADCRDESGMTPLLMAASAGHTGVVQTIVLHTGAQLLDDTDEDGLTALHHAAADGHDEIVGLLLSRGAHTNSRDVYGNTPFLSASQGGHLKVVQLFLQHLGGLALKERGERGRTALHLASCRGAGEVVRCLLLAGADPMIPDDDGRTPRELAEEDAECEAAYDVSAHAR
jgi:ankyrin repeat protein